MANDWAVWEDWFGLGSVFHLLAVLRDTVSPVQEEHCWKRWIIVLNKRDNFSCATLRDPTEQKCSD